MPPDSDFRRVLLALLRRMRQHAGLRQQDLALRLGKPQSYVSKYETGERRLDLLEVMAVCRACGASLSDLAGELEAALPQVRSGPEDRLDVD